MGTASATRLDVERVGPDGSVTDGQQIPRGASAARASAKFALPAGKTMLRFTSYDDEGELLDRWANEIVVPDFSAAQVMLATPRFLLARSPFELRALLSAPAATPTASRRLRKSDRLLVELEAYAAAGTPELSIELLNQKGESLVSLPVPAATGRHPRVEIPLQSLAPATYVLKVTAKTDAHHAEQHVPFRIVP
jgi:hypothetical protein